MNKKQYLIDNKELMTEWNYEKNSSLNINDITIGSGRKVWWKCSKCGNEWEASTCNRSKGRKCPYCTNKKVLVGINDLTKTNPELVLDWDYSANNFFPIDVSKGSGKKVNWKCHVCGQKWTATVLSRSSGTGCPYCSGRRAIKGKNDLQTKQPDIYKEIDFIKNKNMDFTSLTEYSHKKIWWICKKCGFSWEANVSDRSTGRGCPKCAKDKQTSLPEKTIYYYVKKHFSTAIENYKSNWLNKRELDIYIPELQVAIEYDGEAWHKDVKKDLEKDMLCLENNIKIIRIREPKCPILNSSSIIIQLKNLKLEELSLKIKELFKNQFNIQLDINIERDMPEIYKIIDYSIKENSLESSNPQIAKEFNITKNYPLLPSKVTKSSSLAVWWKCSKCGYEWKTSVNNRNKGTGCPKCNKPHNIPPTEKVVIQVTLEDKFIRKYPSIREASRVTGISRRGISGVCNNRYGYKTAGGYKWLYEDKK